MGLGSCLAPYIFLESGLKPRKTQAWPLLPPGEVKVRGFTIRVWKIFHLTSPSPSPGESGGLGGGDLLVVGTGVPRSGNKMGFPLKGLTIFGKTRQTLGAELTPIYYALKFHPPGTWREPRANLQRKQQSPRLPAPARVLTWCLRPTPACGPPASVSRSPPTVRILRPKLSFLLREVAC